MYDLLEFRYNCSLTDSCFGCKYDNACIDIELFKGITRSEYIQEYFSMHYTEGNEPEKVFYLFS